MVRPLFRVELEELGQWPPVALTREIACEIGAVRKEREGRKCSFPGKNATVRRSNNLPCRQRTDLATIQRRGRTWLVSVRQNHFANQTE